MTSTIPASRQQTTRLVSASMGLRHRSQLHGLPEREVRSTSMSTCTLSTGQPARLTTLVRTNEMKLTILLQLRHQASRMAGHTYTPATGHPPHRAQQPPVSVKSTRSVSAKAVRDPLGERDQWRCGDFRLFPLGCPTPLFQHLQSRGKDESQQMRSVGPAQGQEET
jgi:hypothetical protein